MRVPTLEGAASFRVTGWRTGKAHRFNSGELARVVGGCLHDRYGCAPRMRGYDVHVRADCVGETLALSTQLHEEALSRRHKAAYLNKVTIKANVAYAMLREAGLPADGSGAVLDPFCGSGTILLEARRRIGEHRLRRRRQRQRVQGTLANAEAAGFEGRVHCSRADVAAALFTVPKGTLVDAVVSNPPWGVQTGKGSDLKTMYRALLKTAWQLLRPGGRLVVLVLRVSCSWWVTRGAPGRLSRGGELRASAATAPSR